MKVYEKNFKELKGIDVPTPFHAFHTKNAMEGYGTTSRSPVWFEVCDFTDVVKIGFKALRKIKKGEL